jgi:penicillin-binding protein 2
MLIFDELKKNDPQLRLVALALLAGLGVLVAGLWWVQIVSARDYQAHLEMQSFRTVRIPAVRGKILDRNGAVLAENRASYNVSLYLEDLRKDFETAIQKEFASTRAKLKQRMAAEQTRLRRKLNANEKRAFVLEKDPLRQKARYEVASNVVMQISQRLGQPLVLNATNFQRHYETRLALPFPIVTNLNSVQMAIFSEQCASPMGADLEIQSTRFYPYSNIAAHVLGCLQSDNSSSEGEDAFFSYRLPDYRGQLGVEFGYDNYLHGKAGVKSVVVNNIGYRQTDNVWQPAEPGKNLVLTIDLQLQQKAERALHSIYGPTTRGALIVMDVQTGDLVAMASSPTIDPNDSIQGLPPGEDARRLDKILRPQRNRATQERYAPGSIFKTLVGLASLEAGLDPNEEIVNPGYFQSRTVHKPIGDLAAPGQYNFKRALAKSSNTYFISTGLRAGIKNIVRLGQRLHLDEGTGLHTQQEVKGEFPSLQKVSSNWGDGDTANICIGQGFVSATPLQMTVMMAAIANGGKVLWPRLVDRVEPPDLASVTPPIVSPRGRLRDELGVSAQNLKIVCDAMWAEVNEPGGTGFKAAIPGMDICGKTGTAQVMDEHNKPKADTVWFASFAPYNPPTKTPRYAVVVVIETEVNAGTGGGLCAPIAGTVYRALLERERAQMNATPKIALSN